MKVLLDHNLPRQLRTKLVGHDVFTTRWMKWDRLTNGALLAECAAGGFDVFLSNDKKLEYEHNLSRLPVTVVVLDAPSNAMPDVEPFVPVLIGLLAESLAKALYFVGPDGSTLRIDRPR